MNPKRLKRHIECWSEMFSSFGKGTSFPSKCVCNLPILRATLFASALVRIKAVENAPRSRVKVYF